MFLSPGLLSKENRGSLPLMKSLFSELQSYDHVIWDFNGTLLDDAELCVQSVNPLLKEHGLSPIDVHQYRSYFRFPVSDYYSDLGFRLTKEEFSALSDRFHGHYYEFLHQAQLFRGTRELLHELKAAGKTLSVLSAAQQQDLQTALSRFSLHTFFDHIFGLQHRLADSKIARGHELIKKTGIAPEKIVMIGDTLHDLEVGEAIGVEVILLTDGHMDEVRLRSRGTTVFTRPQN